MISARLIPAVLIFITQLTSAEVRKVPELEKQIVEASDLVRAGDYLKAERIYRKALSASLEQHDDYYVARSRVGLAVCYTTFHKFRDAIENADAALRYGVRVKNADIAVRAGLNLSNLYRRMSNYPAAAQTLREIDGFLPEITDAPLKSRAFLHVATDAARRQDWARAEPLFFASIDLAQANNDVQTAALGWNILGYMRYLSKDWKQSEYALTEAFRLRRLAGTRNLGTSYAYLGMLRIAQGDARSALNLLDRAVEVGWNGEALERLTTVYYFRAKAKQALGDASGALADLGMAISRATEWRQGIVPVDADRISYEVSVDRFYDDYIAAGMAEWVRTKDSSLAQKMFELSDQHRSASFRERLKASKQFPPEYWQALAAYREALSSAWRSGKPAATNAEKLELARIEASLGIEQEEDVRAQTADVRRALSRDEALISFHTGESQSWVWALTRDSFEAWPLPGRKQIAPVAKRYREAIEAGTALNGSSVQLYDMLFAKLSTTVHSRKDWLLSLDEGLYDVPFAALGSEKTPIIVRHSLRTLLGAGSLGRPREPIESAGFVAAGDAIYNSADPRWKGPRPKQPNGFARLINTSYEVRAAAKAWTLDPDPKLLIGDSFSRASFDRVLGDEHGVMHIAAHVVQHQTDASQVMVALGLGPNGEPDFLMPADISGKRLRVGLVSLNGCASGAGADTPGAGLIGLTRAWLVAGVTAVAATYWPVPDDRGELFAHMYRDIAAEGKKQITAARAARALQAAQISAIQSNDARSSPRRWAVVFLSSKT